MIAIKDAYLHFGDQVVFDGIDLALDPKRRIGLVGSNGAGKSTLLKIIAGKMALDRGKIDITNGLKIGYLPQELLLTSHQSVFNETFAGCGTLAELQAEAERIEYLLEHEYQDALLERYNQVQERLRQFTPSFIEQMARSILTGLGFSEGMMRKPVSSLSLGWGMRVVLARLMMSGSDFYLFDEPTNHLDLQTKDWFIDYMKSLNAGFLLVCHDRYILDALCDTTVALEQGKMTAYAGNYTFYQKQKEKNLELLYAQYEQQQREIAQKMATIQRFRASASKAQAAQAMLKEVNRIQRITLPPKPKPIKIVLPPAERSARIVCTIKNLAYRFGPQQIFKNISLAVERGQKIALVAPNGTGKSTLLGCVDGRLRDYSGSITLGDRVQVASFVQDQNAVLNQYMTIMEYVDSVAPDGNRARIRGLLGSFLFEGDAVDKKIGVLSGGEKNRLCMAIILLQGANFLLLDEPTNHLDMQSKEVLLHALQAFDGTIVFVSHDHDFVNSLATHIFELSSEGGGLFHGNYDAYRENKRTVSGGGVIKSEAVAAADPSDLDTVKKTLKKELIQLERRISKLESKIQETEQSFLLHVYGTPGYEKLVKSLQIEQKELAEVLSEWELKQQQVYAYE